MAKKAFRRSGTDSSKRSMAQPAIEYLSTFSVAMLILAIVIAIVGLMLFNNNTSTLVPSSCYISAQLHCYQFVVSNNGIETEAAVVFTNDLGLGIYFPNNAFYVFPRSSQESYSGSCYPANAIAGATITCSVLMPGYAPSVGSQLQPDFQIKYSECSNGSCLNYNTSGTSNLYVSQNLPIYPVDLLTLPSGGSIAVNGNEYPSNTLVQFISGTQYSVYASPPSGYGKFEGWLTTGGVVVANSLSQSTTAFTTSAGTLEAVFVCYSLTLDANPSGTGTQTANPTSNGNCAQGSYLPGTQVQITANPAFNYWFEDWSGTGTVSYSGKSDSATVTMNSNIVETASYHECYLLTVNYVGSGSVSRSLSNSAGCATDYYMPNTQVQVYASPSPSWVLGQATNDWTGLGGPTHYTGSTASPTVTMNGDITETANFNPTVHIIISPAAASSGWQFCAGLSGNDGCTSDGVHQTTFVEPYGSTLNYVCTAANYGGAGYSFMSFSDGYNSGSKCNSNAGVSMTAPTTIVANLGYSITVYNNGGPSGSIACVAAAGYSQVCASPGGSASFVASPGTDFNYANVNMGGSGSDSWDGWTGTYSGWPGYLIGGSYYSGFTLTGAVSETANWNTLSCTGSQAFAVVPQGGVDEECVGFSGGSGTWYGIYTSQDWAFPCADGATGCAGETCSGNSCCINPSTWGNAGSFGGWSYFTDTGGGTCGVYYAVTVTASTPPDSSGCYPSVGADVNGYCTNLGAPYYAETYACNDCGGCNTLCHQASECPGAWAGGCEGNDDGDGGSYPYN